LWVAYKAWVDQEFKRRLLAEPSQTLASLGYAGMQAEHTTVVENTPKLHNMVVCTLCSCYPWPVLGLPPVWYKSGPYRSRAVMDPRGVLREKIRLRRLQSVKKLSKGVDSFFDHISAVGRQSIARSSAGNSTVPPKKGLHQANARSRRVQSRRRPLFPEARFEELGHPCKCS